MAEKTSSLLLSGFCGHLSQKCHAGTLSMTKVAKKSFFFFFFKSHLNDIILKQNKLPWFYLKKEKKKKSWYALYTKSSQAVDFIKMSKHFVQKLMLT